MTKIIYSLAIALLYSSHLFSQQAILDQHWCSSTNATQAVFIKTDPCRMGTDGASQVDIKRMAAVRYIVVGGR